MSLPVPQAVDRIFLGCLGARVMCGHSLVHVGSSLFCCACQVVRLFVNIHNTLDIGTGNVFVPGKRVFFNNIF